ncbi:MAG: PEP-CTERM sorting domain-containing protein [Bryobacteraceae bacterium]
MRLLGSVGACALAAALAAGMPAGAATIYSVENLGALGTGSAQVAAISGSGIVTGYVTNAQGDTIPSCFTGCAAALRGIGQANAANAAGTIAGTTYVNGNPYVTVWTDGGRSVATSVPGYGTAVNASGTVAGGYLASNGQLHAFTSGAGNLTDLGTLNGGTWSSAYAINGAGHVAGTSLTSSGLFQAFFSTGNGMTGLSAFARNGNSYAMAINGSDAVVGAAQTSGGWLNAVKWIDGSPTDLGTLGGTQSYAYGIDDSGTAVGYSYLAGNIVAHAFVYVNGVMIDLNDLLPIGSGWTIGDAYGIDDAGEIAAMGTLDSQSYALELLPSGNGLSDPTPTPEPATLLLSGLGLALVFKCFAAKRKSAKVSETIRD